MKLSREESQSKPITIKLESYEEVKIIKELLGMMSDINAERILVKKFDPFSGLWLEIKR